MVKKVSLYSLRRFFVNARWVAVWFVLFLYMQGRFEGMRAFLSDSGEKVNILGLYAMQLCSSIDVTLFGIFLMLLLSEAPFYTEAQNAILIRVGQKKWIQGNMLFCVWITGLFMAMIMLNQVLILFPHVEFSLGWGRVINSVIKVQAMIEYTAPFEFEEMVAASFSMGGALLLGCALRFVVWLTCTFIMFGINLRFKTRLGVLAALCIILLDLFNGLPYSAYGISISSLARISNLNFGYHAFLPDVVVSLAIIGGWFVISWLFILYCQRKSDVADMADQN